MKIQQKHKQRLVLGSLVLILVISSFTYLPVIAGDDDEDDDGVDDDIEEENKRDISVNYDDDDAKIESKLSSDELYNRFMAEMKATSEGLEFIFEFEKDSETNETEISFKVTIPEIVEFIDENEDGIYDALVDSVESIYQINSYKTLVYAVETKNNETVHTFSIETTDGVFSSTMYVSGEFAVVNDLIIAPSQFKFDIEINNFSFTEINSSLALKIELESEFDVEYDEDETTEDEEDGRSSDEQEVEISYGDYTCFFSWLKTATIDGVGQEVLTSPLETDSEKNIIYLNYPKGDEIIHDPKVGIEGLITGWGSLGSRFWVELPGLSRNELLIVSAITLFALTGLVLVFRRKRIA
ncbi:MAG: hypothetical protein KAU62_15640 [Candidatus Heimdallarchaeota archaeon]|nr:hypothetical protein [Candidatus Heimdallarchaeota archaeon]MCG3257536.1 hypothetical protein [Candidatus Heimdallarchaeota archaeon]MCK4612588.1 hypothetical protein [Candidatus Heimdallarchaeota archaeon]